MTTREKELRFTFDMNKLRIEGLENMIKRTDPFSDDIDRAITEIRRLKDENVAINREIYALTHKEFEEVEAMID